MSIGRRASCGLLTIALLACGKNRVGGEITKPVDSASAVAASASASESDWQPAVRAGACNDGVFARWIGEPAAAGSGGLGLTGTGEGGGMGEGIGLGTIGAYDHGSGTGTGPGGFDGGISRKTRLNGSVSSLTSNLNAEAVGRGLCGSFGAFRGCFAAQAPALYGTVTIWMNVAEDGTVESAAPSGGSITDASLTGCLATESKKATLAKSSAGKATVSYAFDWALRTNPPAVKMIESGVVVAKGLPPEVVKRIVRANFPRFRACYDAGLKMTPSLKGIVTVKLVIDTKGAVESATDVGTTLTDTKVRACVVSVFRSLSFPEPEGGKVQVTYPIDFETD